MSFYFFSSMPSFLNSAEPKRFETGGKSKSLTYSGKIVKLLNPYALPRPFINASVPYVHF